MKITAIEPHKRHPDEWHISLDGRYAFTLDGATVVAERVVLDRELSEDEVARLTSSASERRIYDAALMFLAPRPRSRVEVRRRLLQRRPNRPQPDVEVVDRVLERLKRMGLLNDQEFADYWVEQRERFSPRSAYAIGQELRQRGVDHETATSAADPERDAERALEAARRKGATLSRLDFETFRARLGGYLLRRGFSHGQARAAVRATWEDLHDGARPEDDDAFDE